MRKLVCEFFFKDKKKKKQSHFDFKIGPITLKENKKMSLSIAITNEQKVKVSITPVTATGKPAKLDGLPVWSVASGSATLDVAADGLSAFLVSPDSPGDSEILIEADADLGAGVVTISDTVKLSVAGALATSLGLVADAPVAK